MSRLRCELNAASYFDVGVDAILGGGIGLLVEPGSTLYGEDLLCVGESLDADFANGRESDRRRLGRFRVEQDLVRFGLAA
jgi:hypothetical protein